MTVTKRKKKAIEYEAEVIPGIEDVALDELRSTGGSLISDCQVTRPGFLRFVYIGRPEILADLRAAIALYRVYRFGIPRPKGLLGHQHFTRLTSILRETVASWSSPPVAFGLAAAGSDSSVIQRLRRELENALSLAHAEDGKGELFLRLVRRSDKTGWEILLRTTPQPLSKRAYRVVDMPGALNATVAFAMTALSPQNGTSTVVNLCSGSSTILIEHGMVNLADRLIAVEISRDNIATGRRNAEASGQHARIQHLAADAGKIPLPTRSVDRLYADLPFGHLMGSHTDNISLYPAVLREATRLARPDATFILLTHEVNLMRRCLRSSSWSAIEERRVNLSGLHPRLFVLRQNMNTI